MSLALEDGKAAALDKIATLDRLAARGNLWIVYSSTCPIATTEDKIEEHLGETRALLHYARIGIENS